jgi:hypothetical protein
MKKDFDCVEMKRRAALAIYEETKDLTREEEIAYWRRKNEEFMARQKAAAQGQVAATAK